jgi:hypothetical protein
MSKFLTPLQMELMVDENGIPLRTRDGNQLYRLLANFVYRSDVAGLITVPAGFVTDLASIPQAMLWLFGEIAQEPSIPHDFAYSTHIVSREIADKMLYEACILTGEPKWKAKLIYAGVRVGGASHWDTQHVASAS